MAGRVVHSCCEAITGRHSTLCPAFTPLSKPRVSGLARQILRDASELADGRRISGARAHAAAGALERRDMVRLAREVGFFGQGSQVYVTEFGMVCLEKFRSEGLV